MNDINNVEGLSTNQIRDLVNQGGKFVIYTYCISLVVVTLKRSSGIYFIKPGKSRVTQGLGWFFLTLILGWWGIPWGPIYTIGCLYNVLSGCPGNRAARTVSRCALRGKSGLHSTGWWITSTRGNPQASATENRPPSQLGAVRVKRWCKRPPVGAVTCPAW